MRLEVEAGKKVVEVPREVLDMLKADGGNPLPGKPPPEAATLPPSPATGATAPGIGPAAASPGLQEIAGQIAACRSCELAKGRTLTVPGQGNPRPKIVFVGEGPGREEDRKGLAFIGPAGQLLTRMIKAMGLSREDVFIANIVKCRPPGNRPPTETEMKTCLPFLCRQLEHLQPQVIICLGNTAIRGLLDSANGISRRRGQWSCFGKIPVMPTFHPAYLLRFPAARRQAWEDLKSVLRFLDMPVPKR